ncbi:MAG: hypothetical protein WC718_17270 [Phycisphaerales bacterium]|jgi:hypothetical protein
MKTKIQTNRLALLALGLVALLSPLVAAAKEDAKGAVKPYPLKLCIVTDNDLGSMGDPRTFVYEGQEIKICCKPCEKKFLKTPEKYLEKLEPKKS